MWRVEVGHRHWPVAAYNDLKLRLGENGPDSLYKHTSFAETCAQASTVFVSFNKFTFHLELRQGTFEIEADMF